MEVAVNTVNLKSVLLHGHQVFTASYKGYVETRPGQPAAEISAYSARSDYSNFHVQEYE
jgi:hypothetical protein